MSETLSDAQVNLLEVLCARGRTSLEFSNEISTVEDRSALLEAGLIILDWRESLGYGYILSKQGLATLEANEAQQESTLLDTIYNGREELARQMHDPATLDSVSVDPVLAILREVLPLDTIETPIEGVKRLAHYNQQGADTIYNIVQQSGCNDMAEILDALKTQRARIAELEAQNEALEKRLAYRGKLLRHSRAYIINYPAPRNEHDDSKRRIIDLVNNIDVALAGREEEQNGYDTQD